MAAALTLTGCSGDFTLSATDSASGAGNTEDPASTSGTSGSTGTGGPGDESTGEVGTSTITGPASASDTATNGTTDTSTGADVCPGAWANLEDGTMICCEGSAAWPGVAETHLVTLTVTVDDEPFVSDNYDDGEIFLVDRKSGDRIALGSVQEGTLSAEAFAGVYDVVYEAPAFPKLLPRNSSAVLLEGLTVPTGDSPAVNIRVVDVNGEVSLDNKPPPMKGYDSGRIYFVDRETGARTFVGRTSEMVDGKFKSRLIPGKMYDVHYEAESVQTQLPINSDARIEADVAVNDDGSLSSPILKINTVPLEGDLLLADEVLAPGTYNRANIYIEDEYTHARTKVLDSSKGGFKGVRVIDNAAEYRVFYEVGETQGVAPSNEWARLDIKGILGEGPFTAAELKSAAGSLSIPLITIAGAVTVDMAPLNPDPNNQGELLVVHGDDRAVIGAVQAGINARLVADSYGVFFRHDVSDGGLPVNTLAELLGVSIDADAPDLNLNIKTAALSGTFTVGGLTPPGSIYDDGRIFLRNAAGDSVFLGRTRDGVFDRRVVVGDYDVHYAVESSQGGVPANHDVIIKEGLKIGGDVADMTIDVPTLAFAENVPLKGGGGVGHFFLRNIRFGDEVQIGSTGDEKLAATIVPGDYELIYRAESPGAGTPENQGRNLGCFHIDGEW